MNNITPILLFKNNFEFLNSVRGTKNHITTEGQWFVFRFFSNTDFKRSISAFSLGKDGGFLALQEVTTRL